MFRKILKSTIKKSLFEIVLLEAHTHNINLISQSVDINFHIVRWILRKILEFCF